MDTEADPCGVCGGTDSKLIDGFYYCVECGTQNTNVRETLLEDKALGDGTFAVGNRKKIVKVQEKGIEMSGEWYKWHAFNFIISGLADELISLGAKPTFKMKLLWIWTRYIKKYQDKSEIIMNKTSQDDNNQTALPSFMMAEDSNSVNEAIEEETSRKKSKNEIMEGSKRDIKFFSKGLIIAMLYVALNLDESEIQLSHLFRFINEKQIDIWNVCRFVPNDINVKKIPMWINFIHSKPCTAHQVRALAMSLLKELNLGKPKVPDLRKIINNFLTELCLPNDFKPFIYSLMHFRKCDYLDVDHIAKSDLIHIPDYEGTAMTYVLIAVKICFGLDCEYEIKLSDIVDKVNDEKNLPKSYRIGKYSEQSERLFSFRDWCSYIQFRKVMLCKYNVRMAEKNCADINDYVYLEQVEERPKRTEKLPDKISMEIISKIPQEHPVGIIPKELFAPTLTPLTDYTDVIIDYCQEPDIKLLLAEDFKRYSLKYVYENLELLDSNMENIITGVSIHNKTESDVILGTIVTKKAKTKMVYIKNCENRNWIKTNPPTMEHVTCEEIENDTTSDDGYDSNTSKEKCLDSVTDQSITEQSTMEKSIQNTIEDQIIADGSVDRTITEKTTDEESIQNNVIDKSDESFEKTITVPTTAHEIDEKTLTEHNTMDGNIQNTAPERSKEDETDKSRDEERKRQIIIEEDANKNIFDDYFEDLDLKEECEKISRENERINEDALDFDNNYNADDIEIQNDNFPDEDFDRRSNISDDFLPTFNPDTFDREKTIKELILLACKKYNISVPTEYKVQEPRKRKRKLDHEAVPVKRSKKATYEGKVTVNQLVSNYYDYLQTDFVNKVQQEMSLAIRNAELESQNLEQNNDILTTDLQISVVERNIENGSNSPTAHSDRVSMNSPNVEQNIERDTTNKTLVDDEMPEADENIENKLFEEDEEMELKDLFPKGDPKFDEEKYETNQLYMKVKGHLNDIFIDVEPDPEIDEILLKKINESTEFGTMKTEQEEQVNKSSVADGDTDSEDEIPLNILKQESELIDKMYKEEGNYEYLVKNDTIPNYNYWIRYYDRDFMLRSKDWYTKFDEELKQNTPTSFYFVIQECASILNCTNFYLYKKMQAIEEKFILEAGCRKKKRKSKMK